MTKVCERGSTRDYRVSEGEGTLDKTVVEDLEGKLPRGSWR